MILGYSTTTDFEVTNAADDKIGLLDDEDNCVIVVKIPTSQKDIWNLESAEQTLQDYKDKVTEQERIYKVRVDALAKLSAEEKKALGF